jgi:uncharacterized protein YhbP (UPF0306 family)
VADPRELLEDYVRNGKVMQLSTLDGHGDPYVNNLWFASTVNPDRLYFISRPDRLHCEYVRERPRVAGAILAIELTAPDQKVRGVTFTGTAVELPKVGIDAQIGVYSGRWPQTANAIDPVRMAAGETHHRVYEVRVLSWVLYDEENFKPPRQPVQAR